MEVIYLFQLLGKGLGNSNVSVHHQGNQPKKNGPESNQRPFSVSVSVIADQANAICDSFL